QRFFLAGADLVTGSVSGHEALVGLVSIECADDVITITPRVAAMRVVFEAVRFGEADDVEPMAPPPLAVMRTGQQLLDQLLPGVRRFVGGELLDLLRGRRQPDHVKVDAPDQRRSVTRWRRLQPILLQPLKNKGVNGILHPGAVRSERKRRDGRRRTLHKSPMPALTWSVCAERGDFRGHGQRDQHYSRSKKL